MGLLEEATRLKNEFLNIRNLVLKRSVLIETNDLKKEKIAKKIMVKFNEAIIKEKKFIKDLLDNIGIVD